MRSSGADLARLLLRKADNDLMAVRIGLDHGAPLDNVCYHIQQAAEKSLKAVLAADGVEYGFTHDLRELLESAMSKRPVLVVFRDTVPEYTEFAVRCGMTIFPGSAGKMQSAHLRSSSGFVTKYAI